MKSESTKSQREKSPSGAAYMVLTCLLLVTLSSCGEPSNGVIEAAVKNSGLQFDEACLVHTTVTEVRVVQVGEKLAFGLTGKDYWPVRVTVKGVCPKDFTTEQTRTFEKEVKMNVGKDDFGNWAAGM